MSKQQLETNVVKPSVSIFAKETEYRLISLEDETNMDKLITEIDSYMANNHGFGKEDSVKDELYGTAISKWEDYADVLRNAKFTFYLNRKQYTFLTNLLMTKMEYDVNTLFLAIELTDMLRNWKESGGKHEDDTTFNGYIADATEITYIYHLIAKHTVKGLTNDSYLFAEVLKRIGDISKVIKYYDTNAQNASAEIQKWAASFEPQENQPELGVPQPEMEKA